MHYRYHVMSMLGVEKKNPHGDVFTKTATDGAEYPTVAELQAQWAALAKDFQAALTAKSEEAWDAPATGAHDEKSLRDQVTFFAWHEGYHMGALGAIRKAMGHLGPAEKVMAAREAGA
jgi:uncharacterized damage-inducible protein DinB